MLGETSEFGGVAECSCNPIAEFEVPNRGIEEISSPR